MKFSFSGELQRFPGAGGWFYVVLPSAKTRELKTLKFPWGMYPVTARVGRTTWQTKLMTKQGGDFFIALKASVRRAEGLQLGMLVEVSCTMAED